MEREVDVLVAGGGIAGMTAGVTSARLGRDTLVLTGDLIGGQLVSIGKVEGFPGFPEGVPGHDLCPMAQEQAACAGADFMMARLEHVAAQDGLWRAKTDDGNVLARAIILATGSRLRALAVPGEERLRGKGVSHCASCDAPLLRNQVVAVVGGGDSAMQESLTLAQFASKVIVLQRGAELTGQPTYRERIHAHPNIEIRFGVTVEEIIGDDAVAGLRTHDQNTGALESIEVGAVFAYIGLQPNTEFMEDCLKLDQTGGIPTDGWMRTELNGVCAAGNIRCGSSFRAVGAAGDGASAAVAVDQYLADGSWRGEIGDPASK